MFELCYSSKKILTGIVFSLFLLLSCSYVVKASSPVDLATDITKVSASSNYSDRVAARAFDNLNTDYIKDAWEANTNVGWLKYDFGIGNEKVIKGYTVSGSSYIWSSPKTWSLEGSNNDQDWTALHQLSNQPMFTELETRTYTINNTQSYRFYRLNITANQGNGYLIVGEMELFGETVPSTPPQGLSASGLDKVISLNWSRVENASGYNIKRSESSNGPYSTIATNIDGTTYTDPNVTNGTTYYYVITAVNGVGESENSNEATATLSNLAPILDVIIKEQKIKVGQELTSEIALRNANGIYAEDFTIQYDSIHLQYIGLEEVAGYKVYNTPMDNNGTLRFVVASQGVNYGISSDTIFLKLKFKAKAVGTGIVNALKGRIADTTNEFDLDEENCLEDSVIIQLGDVNMNGEYTLLDLAIDAAHFGELGSNLDPARYVANQVGDDTIRDEDLLFIVNEILINTNYTPNF